VGLTNRHTGCGNGKWAQACGADKSLVEMTDDMKDFILDLHNKARSVTARGQLVCDGELPPATRMATVQWDDTLADLAEMNAMKCTMHHSDCMNTPEFKQAGQNVGIQSTTGEFPDDKEAAKMIFTPWFEEYKLTSREAIKSNPEYDG
jgi:hypothetical protein